MDEARRGRLTVYLGAAPGVGKTYAMLSEARRRFERGTDVVVGYVETHGRSHTAAMVEGLEVVPRREIPYRGTTFTEMDTEAVIARRPAVVCIDELAHTNVPGSRHEKRAEDVEQIRAAGIDVITTVNIQHLESLNDAVAGITGVRQRETVPDDVVRTADQIQLVDMSPDALRRRMAHGNIYRAEQIDASLTSYFRVGNLTALRELALLWLADRVDDALDDYRRAHRIEAPWPAKERIVVAVTGGPETETLLRRGARLAQRAAGSDLLAVHVIASDGLANPDENRIAHAQRLVASLGGTFHSVVGEDVPAAVVEFASGANATMIIVGVSRHGRVRRLFSGTTGDRIASLAGAIDVHLVTHGEVAHVSRRRPHRSPLSRERQIAGVLSSVSLPLLLTVALHTFNDPNQLPLDVLLFLALTVLVALVGGLLPALIAALEGFVLMNWFFTPPFHRLTISELTDLVALLVFVAVAVGVATVVDRASRRAADAVLARAEAATMSSLSRSVLTGQDTADAIVARLRETFGQSSASLLVRTPAGWSVLASSGTSPACAPDEGDTRVQVDDDHVIVLCGAPLRASDQRVLEGFAVQTGLVLEYRRLREREERAAALERAESTSTAILRAVSHDLRTPLATMRTAVDGLVSGSLDSADRTELVAAVDSSTDQLERLIDNLLDLSRIRSGLLHPVLVERSLEEVLPLAVAGQPGGAVSLEVDESAPLVLTDAGLLERVVANLVTNAVRASAGIPVRVLAHVLPASVEILVVDRGPGVPPALRERMFDPFQRLDDTSPGGLGLGLAVARGLTEALGGELSAEDTPGGGLTMVVSIPRAPGEDRP
ncbi:ATP-binding protein [Nocardioides sp. T2.26MG-1]|uniref:ATP-binding protein n=1 Tax=Nocardioides sp. T2.26MG-1 TaxID=3041166 RepID=UPI0024776D41|nr:ATP-binding protein [Nocardioides sp. T2.26MG-1]CAI9402019.1 Sensor protein KdpD [Nocardioides sp. T2.26MG-1]